LASPLARQCGNGDAPAVAALALGAAGAARFEHAERRACTSADQRSGRRVTRARLRDQYLGPGFPPLVVRAAPPALALDRSIAVRGDVSSQFLTALLLALPLRAGPGKAAIEVAGS
jgi:hypothetical protein